LLLGSTLCPQLRVLLSHLHLSCCLLIEPRSLEHSLWRSLFWRLASLLRSRASRLLPLDSLLLFHLLAHLLLLRSALSPGTRLLLTFDSTLLFQLLLLRAPLSRRTRLLLTFDSTLLLKLLLLLRLLSAPLRCGSRLLLSLNPALLLELLLLSLLRRLLVSSRTRLLLTLGPLLLLLLLPRLFLLNLRSRL